MKNKRIIKPNHVFQEIIGKKQNIANNSFVIYFQKNPTPDFLKYGISVGKKLGNAVMRNKIKRQVRMMINNQLQQYDNLDYQIVILVKKNYLQKTYADNEELLALLLQKISKIK